MAVAAKNWERTHTAGIFDFFEWEAEMEHAPEAETYGRSLGTIRRLGAFMIETLSREEATASPEAAQAKAEFYTSVEEGFGTDMELGGGLEVRDFDERPVMDGRVMAKDLKTPISSMTEAGLACAQETGRKDRRFLPQLTRSEWDHTNALIVDQMARGETDYNTRIVISPFPEEGAAESGDEYWRNVGYVPHLRRGFVQLYHMTKEGILVSGSLSFDGSDKQRLREIFDRFGIEIPTGEVTDNWLKYAITGTLSEADARELATGIADTASDPRYRKNTNTVDVTKQYGPLMDRIFNESYIHVCESLARGYQTAEARKLIHQFADKAHHFNRRYAEALYRMRADGGFTGDDSIVLHELLVYSTIEMMRALHLKKDIAGQDCRYANHDAGYLQLAGASFQSALSDLGADGARSNRVYSACGLSITLGKDGQGGNGDKPQAAFGGVDRTGEKSENDKIPSIIKCIACKRPSPKEKVVKAKSWCCPHCKYEVDICTGEVIHQSVQPKSGKSIETILAEELEKRRTKPGAKADLVLAA